jgi:hypothetical protein
MTRRPKRYLTRNRGYPCDLSAEDVLGLTGTSTKAGGYPRNEVRSYLGARGYL